MKHKLLAVAEISGDQSMTKEDVVSFFNQVITAIVSFFFPLFNFFRVYFFF